MNSRHAGRWPRLQPATTHTHSHTHTHTHARTHTLSKKNNQPLPTCDILAHTYETRGSDLFRSHVCSSLLSPPLLLLLLLLLLSSTSSPLAVPSLLSPLSLPLALSQRWTIRMVSLPGIPVGHPTARLASWKKPCGCWEAGWCGSDGRWREGRRGGGRDDEEEEAGITQG